MGQQVVRDLQEYQHISYRYPMLFQELMGENSKFSVHSVNHLHLKVVCTVCFLFSDSNSSTVSFPAYDADVYVLQEVCPRMGRSFLPTLFKATGHGIDFQRKFVEVSFFLFIVFLFLAHPTAKLSHTLHSR